MGGPLAGAERGAERAGNGDGDASADGNGNGDGTNAGAGAGASTTGYESGRCSDEGSLEF